MITAQQLIRKASAEGVQALTVERDYVLAHCLVSISRVPEADKLFFKGGTALRMCYFDDYRYSADLDFSLGSGLTKNEAIQAIERGLEATRSEIGFVTLALVTQKAVKIIYEGPLGKERPLKLDLDDAELVLDSAIKPLLPRYPDVPSNQDLNTYTLEEITAEKLRCVIQRFQCRDFYDLHYLLEIQGVDLDGAWSMFERKARHKGIDPALFFPRLDSRMPGYEEHWADEIGTHLGGALPHFKATHRELMRQLRPRRVQSAS